MKLVDWWIGGVSIISGQRVLVLEIESIVELELFGPCLWLFSEQLTRREARCLWRGFVEGLSGCQVVVVNLSSWCQAGRRG